MAGIVVKQGMPMVTPPIRLENRGKTSGQAPQRQAMTRSDTHPTTVRPLIPLLDNPSEFFTACAGH
ncbi:MULTISPECIES: hypothetical protein [Pseudomonas]|uniref:hypothetical protein n=1 Tax=Pseudomonas TaxID=286 RepID=UPI000C889D4A|nr:MULTISPECIES: hypothetical protein [Pseudomonas]PMY42577.1 hypothetical protein C1Y36_19155 [Pseudomonas sp. FW306-2-2C-D06C]PYC41901.1 hypothetical protein DMW99_00625 [Pseudomonas chlororaphis]